MTATLNSTMTDLKIVQNPGLGAYSIWRFGLGHQLSDERPVSFALAFLVLPIVLHRETLQILIATQKSSGLALFGAKLGKEREKLLAVHDRTLLLRNLSLQSVGLGVGTKLLSIDYAGGKLRANDLESKPRRPLVPERIKDIGNGSEKLGLWFSQLTAAQIVSTLQVEF